MPDFQQPVEEVRIVIDDGEFAGAECVANRRVGIAVIWSVVQLMDKAPDGETFEDKKARMSELFELLANDIILSWNLVDRRNRPIPVSPAGMGRVVPELFGQIVAYWMSAMQRAPAPLASPSEPGELPAEILLPD